jgi:hypothetical protein
MVPDGGVKGGRQMQWNEVLEESAALVQVIQVQLLVSAVFAQRDPDQCLDVVRTLSRLRRRMLGLIERGAATRTSRRRAARTRL